MPKWRQYFSRLNVEPVSSRILAFKAANEKYGAWKIIKQQNPLIFFFSINCLKMGRIQSTNNDRYDLSKLLQFHHRRRLSHRTRDNKEEIKKRLCFWQRHFSIRTNHEYESANLTQIIFSSIKICMNIKLIEFNVLMKIWIVFQ